MTAAWLLLGPVLASATPAADVVPAEVVLHAGEAAVTFHGRLFTLYSLIDETHDPARRPFMAPVLAADGVAVTADQSAIHGDHPHHRSLWIGYGSVNGVDHWSGTKGKHPPRETMWGGPRVEGNTLTQDLVWEDRAGDPLVRERRTARFFMYPDGVRAIDLVSRFTAAVARVTFTPTPEAGLIGARLSAAIAARPAVTCAAGAGEAACGERPSAWCDVSGPAGRRTAGLAILAHPSNPRGGDRWVVRGYGLLAADPFSPGPVETVPETPLVVRHRVLVHVGDARAADVAGKFAAYARATPEP